MKVMNLALLVVAVVLIAYTTTALYLFYTTSAEPSTLTTCVFAVCGCECGVMGWIKTAKEKKSTQQKENQL
ncbi:hypothetical protein RFF05_01875 [Bengtsoniella intestinalis]|uniref:hypothetical protein n=1 Tax=Bengtsoniella intestinalis TaxID=3073143 RepID=UPI00391EFCED